MKKLILLAALALSTSAYASGEIVDMAADAVSAEALAIKSEKIILLTRPNQHVSDSCPVVTMLTINYDKRTAHLEQTMALGASTHPVCDVMFQPMPRDYKDLESSGPLTCGRIKYIGTGVTHAGKTTLTIVDNRINTCVRGAVSDVTTTEEAANGAESHLYSAILQ